MLQCKKQQKNNKKTTKKQQKNNKKTTKKQPKNKISNVLLLNNITVI
jgi:hypothetical protein